MTEEAYTSKCDVSSLEGIKHQENYLGKRIKRGLFQSQKGIINADLNGAINIMRKKINLTKITGFCLNNPIVVNVITPKILNISRDVIKIISLPDLSNLINLEELNFKKDNHYHKNIIPNKSIFNLPKLKKLKLSGISRETYNEYINNIVNIKNLLNLEIQITEENTMQKKNIKYAPDDNFIFDNQDLLNKISD